jgi:hypothetical protein
MLQRRLIEPEVDESGYSWPSLQSVQQALQSVQQVTGIAQQTSSTTDIKFTIPLAITPTMIQTPVLPLPAQPTSIRSTIDINTISFNLLTETSIALPAFTSFAPQLYPSTLLTSTLTSPSSFPHLQPHTPISNPLPQFSVLNPTSTFTANTHSMSPGAIAGITVGAILGAVVLGACVVVILVGKRMGKMRQDRMLRKMVGR